MNQEPLRLLLLAQDPGWCEVWDTSLASQGLEVHRCSLAQLAAEQPDQIDLLVLDLNLGLLARHHVTQWFQGLPLKLPLLAVGTGLNESHRVELLESGVDDVLDWPLSLPEFVARCRALWRRQQVRRDQWRASHPQTHLRHGPLEMHVEEHRVWCGGQPVELPPREFRLLEHLLRHPGQVFDRETLLEQVWGQFASLELDSKTVDVHIRWLRLKLERDPSAPELIVTVRGRGYGLGQPPRAATMN